MRKVYELNNDGKFVSDFIIHDEDTVFPDNWTEEEMPCPIYTPVFKGERNAETGEWVGVWEDAGEQGVSAEQSSLLERLWRNAEIQRADIELNKVQDGMGTGTVSAWREYRCSLRNWPESPDFPDSTKRPVAPDA